MRWNKFGKILILLAAVIIVITFVAVFFVDDGSDDEQTGTVDVILFAGQSNMVGYGEKESKFTIRSGEAYEYLNVSNEIIAIKDPVGERTGRDSDKALKGSMIPSFIYYYLKYTDHKVIAVPSAYGATSVSDWQPGGACLSKTISKYDHAVSYIEKNTNYQIDRKILVWLQGETDTLKGTSKEKYKADFRNTYDALKSSSGIDVCIMIPAGSRRDAPLDNAKAINEAEYELINENDDMILGSESAFDFSLNKSMLKTDILHFNTKALELLGKESAQNYFASQK